MPAAMFERAMRERVMRVRRDVITRHVTRGIRYAIYAR